MNHQNRWNGQGDAPTQQPSGQGNDEPSV
jgi:hypothetical protein